MLFLSSTIATESESYMPFLPFLGASIAAVGLLKLGALAVMVKFLTAVIAALLFVVLGLAALLGWKHINKP